MTYNELVIANYVLFALLGVAALLAVTFYNRSVELSDANAELERKVRIAEQNALAAADNAVESEKRAATWCDLYVSKPQVKMCFHLRRVKGVSQLQPRDLIEMQEAAKWN